jgi:hypothetical protein
MAVWALHQDLRRSRDLGLISESHRYDELSFYLVRHRVAFRTEFTCHYAAHGPILGGGRGPPYATMTVLCIFAAGPNRRTLVVLGNGGFSCLRASIAKCVERTSDRCEFADALHPATWQEYLLRIFSGYLIGDACQRVAGVCC